MKDMNAIVIFLAILNYFTINAMINQTSNWVLDIKNENNTDEIIELRPGVLTKIILIVSHEDNIDIIDRSFDKNFFTISLKDNDNIMFYPNEEFNIIPSEALEYIAYIGLKCDHSIISDNYTLEFDVKKIDLDDININNGNLIINPVPITINDGITFINIEPIETNLAEKGYSLFKITNEIYNMENITIKSEGNNNKNFIIEDIEIKAFKDRKKYAKTENENHGILFDSKFGTKVEYKKLKGETNTTFNLIIENDDNKRRCFDINPKSSIVTININDKRTVTLNESVKEAVLYSIENVTPKRDKTNNIQFKIDLPVAPVIIECVIKGQGNTEEKDIITYKDYILNSGKNIIKFDNLNSNNEYSGECRFFSVSFKDTKFKILIGKEKKKNNKIVPLFPSSSSYSKPQCLEFTFTSKNKDTFEEQIKKFADFAEKLCNKTIAEDENIISRIFGKFICEKQEMNNNDDYYKNKSIICIGSSPTYNPEIIEEEDDINESNNYYSEKVDKFIGLLNTTAKITNLFCEEEEDVDLELIGFNRYYDLNPPDINKIKLEVINDGGLAKKDKLYFKITSSNEQPIECFYNKYMRSDETIKLIKLYKHKNDHKNIILPKNEEKMFETQLKDKQDKYMYSLYLNCYNLPGAKIRYEQTGIFIPYTYLYTDIEDQSIVEKQKGEIKCDENTDKMNPNCLKEQYNNLYDILKTNIPETDENEEIVKFSQLSNKAQVDLLDEIFNNFNEEEMVNANNSTQIFQNLINKEQFLTKRDCSFYANRSSNNSLNEINNVEYKICREHKKIKQKKIIDLLKTNFNCKNISILISKNGISNNIEENIKYVILLVDEITNNADSFSEGDSEFLFNIITCLQENYEAYWNQVKDYLEKKGSLNISISAIKKDISNLLINSMTKLVKVLHFDEIDNYISDKEKNITKHGLMAYKKGKEIHNNIKHFMKYFNEFGDGIYNLTDSFIINITVNNEEKNSLQEEDEKVIVYKDKGIILLMHPQSIMKYYNAYAMQVINYESPLISIKASNNIYNTFISITLYDNKGNEIKINKIPEDIRPNILYDKTVHKYMNSCYFYDEEIEDLAEKGVSINNNYIYNDTEYLKCTAEHLTCFTAGNYYVRINNKTNSNNKSNEKTGIVKFIILGSIFVVIFILVIIIIIVKNKRRRNNSIDNIEKKIGEIELEE